MATVGLADDSAVYSKALAATLTHYGHQTRVITPHSSNNADLDVVVMDHSYFQQNQQTWETVAANNTPIVAVSAHWSAPAVERMWSQGAQDVISKNDHPAWMAERVLRARESGNVPAWATHLHDGPLQTLMTAHLLGASGHTEQAHAHVGTAIDEIRDLMAASEQAQQVRPVTKDLIYETLNQNGYRGHVTIDTDGSEETLTEPDWSSWLSESLANCAHHAQATHIQIHIRAGAWRTLTVTDNGQDTRQSQTRHTGSLLQRERARSTQGLWSVRGTYPHGTTTQLAASH